MHKLIVLRAKQFDELGLRVTLIKNTVSVEDRNGIRLKLSVLRFRGQPQKLVKEYIVETYRTHVSVSRRNSAPVKNLREVSFELPNNAIVEITKVNAKSFIGKYHTEGGQKTISFVKTGVNEHLTLGTYSLIKASTKSVSTLIEDTLENKKLAFYKTQQPQFKF